MGFQIKRSCKLLKPFEYLISMVGYYHRSVLYSNLVVNMPLQTSGVKLHSTQGFVYWKIS